MKLISPTGADIIKIRQVGTGDSHIAEVFDDGSGEFDVQGTGETEGMFDCQEDYRDIMGTRAEFSDTDRKDWPECCLRLVEYDAVGKPCAKSHKIAREYYKRRGAAIQARKSIARHSASVIRLASLFVGTDAGVGSVSRDTLKRKLELALQRLSKTTKNYVK
jgi:hypothetical protein